MLIMRVYYYCYVGQCHTNSHKYYWEISTDSLRSRALLLKIMQGMKCWTSIIELMKKFLESCQISEDCPAPHHQLVWITTSLSAQPITVSVAHGNQKDQRAETSLMHPYPAPGTSATKDSLEMSAWLGKHQDQDGNSEDNETYWNVAASNYDWYLLNISLCHTSYNYKPILLLSELVVRNNYYCACKISRKMLPFDL